MKEFSFVFFKESKKKQDKEDTDKQKNSLNCNKKRILF